MSRYSQVRFNVVTLHGDYDAMAVTFHTLRADRLAAFESHYAAIC